MAKPAAAAAFAAAIGGFFSGIYLQIRLADREEGADGLLAAVERDPADFLLAAGLLALSLLATAGALLYLYRAARYRREQTPPTGAILAVLGAVTLAVVTMVRQVELVDTAREFIPFAGPGDAEEAAEDAIRDSLSPTIQGIGLGGSLALAFATVMINLNAMRAGLLSRFMGILGVIIGVLFVIPLGVQVLQLFWLTALGVLFLGRWPGGRGPAWQTGEALPWPSAAQQREEIERRRAEREAEENPEPEPDPERPRRSSRKRRKKRR